MKESTSETSGATTAEKSGTKNAEKSEANTEEVFSNGNTKDTINMNVRHGNRWWDEAEIEKSFKEYLDDEHFRKVTIDSISDEIVDIVLNEAESNMENPVIASLKSEGITW